MTKTKIFTLSIMILLGGFVLSGPSDVLAQNANQTPALTTDEIKARLDKLGENYNPSMLRNDIAVSESIQQGLEASAVPQGVIEHQRINQAYDISHNNALKQGATNEELEKIEKERTEALAKSDDRYFSSEEKQLVNPYIRDDVKKFIDDRLVLVEQDGKITQNKGIDRVIEDYTNKVNTLVDEFTKATDDAKFGCSGGTTEHAWKNILGRSFSYASYANEYVASLKCPDMASEERQKKLQKLLDIGRELDETRHMLVAQEALADYTGYVYSYYFCPKYEKDGKTCATNLAHFDFIINEDDGTLRSITGTSQGCVPLPFRIYEAKSCLICPLMDIIYSAIQTASTSSFNKLGKPLSTLVLIGLSIWIAFMVLQNVSSMTKQDAPKFLTDLFKNSFKVIIIFFLLRDSTIIYGIIIGPILKAGFELGTSFLSVKLSSIEGCSANLLAIGSGGDAGVLPQYVYANINCFIRAVQYELATSQAIGAALMCVSTHQAKGNLSVIAKVVPDLLMMLQGGLIYLISFIMTLAFGFYLIDATVQLGIFGTILPFLLLCWPFKKTNSYFQKGVGIFMNSWFVYVFMGVVVNVCMNLIAQSLTGGKGGFTDIENAINGNDVSKLQKLLDIGYSGFLILVACCVMAIKLMQKVEEIASKFSGGGGLNLGIGAKVGGLAASGATGGAKAAASFIGNRAKGVANAKVWGKEGQEKSIADMWRSGKHAVGRGIANKIQGAGKGLGRILGGLGGHRN